MKRLLRVFAGLVLCLALVACVQQMRLSGASDLPAARADLLRVASLNVHYIVLGRETGDWGVADWEGRRVSLDGVFRALEADLVAFQEMESFARGSDGSVNLARDWLLARNPGYRAAANGDWRAFPSTQPIFYRPDRLRMVDQGWFFFSETPDVLYARTFNGSWPAFCSWAEFEDVQGRRFRVANVHFDFSSRSNRRRSAELVRDRLAPVIEGGLPVILLGDLNAVQGAYTMEVLEAAGLSFPRVPSATFHFDRGLHLVGAIDHVGLGPGVTLAGGPYVVQRQFAGDWPSDHHPVVADVVVE